MGEENYASKRWAELESPPKLQERKVWTGIYKGVRFEINNFSIGKEEDLENCWTHYIIIPLDTQLEKEWADKLWLSPDYSDFGRLSYDYWDSVISSIEFHGGCTYYNKENGPDDKCRVIKVGCDYQHYWDMGKEYDLAYVYAQVKETIDSFIELVGGKVKVRSSGDGKWRYLEDFEK